MNSKKKVLGFLNGSFLSSLGAIAFLISLKEAVKKLWETLL